MAKNIKTHAAPTDEQIRDDEEFAAKFGCKDSSKQITLCRRRDRRQGTGRVVVAISDEPTCKQCQKILAEVAASTAAEPPVTDSEHIEAKIADDVNAYRQRLRDLGRWDLLSGFAR